LDGALESGGRFVTIAALFLNQAERPLRRVKCGLDSIAWSHCSSSRIKLALVVGNQGAVARNDR
jgi:hypothetical protein